MKPLAILKDSLREAWDSKLLFVMLILTGVFLVGVASVGYHPGDSKPVFQSVASQLGDDMAHVNQGKIIFPTGRRLAYFAIQDVQAKNNTSDPSADVYRFTMVVTPFDHAEIIDRRKKKAPPIAAQPANNYDGFERLVAAWNDDGTGSLSQYTNNGLTQPGSIDDALAPVTDQMIENFIRGRFASENMPIVEYQRLADVQPGIRAFSLSAGPCTETRDWPVRFTIGFGLFNSEETVMPLGIILKIILDIIVNSAAGMIVIVLGVIITSFFIPNMLRKGSVDLMISKPISRITLLLFKFIGGTFFVLILSTAMIGGVWIITGFRAGIWNPKILLMIPMLTFSFMVLYSVSTAIAVWTRSSITCILVTLAFGGGLWVVGKVYFFAQIGRFSAEMAVARKAEKTEPKIATWVKVTEQIKDVIPRWRDIDALAGEIVDESVMTKNQRQMMKGPNQNNPPSWFGTFGVSLAWMTAFLGFACWRFATKDY